MPTVYTTLQLNARDQRRRSARQMRTIPAKHHRRSEHVENSRGRDRYAAGCEVESGRPVTPWGASAASMAADLRFRVGHSVVARGPWSRFDTMTLPWNRGLWF